MSDATKRLFLGGLASSITKDEIESRFEKFGEVSGVNLVKKDSVNGTQEHCFAHFTYKGDEKQLKKLMTTFNNTRWKGKTVRIEPAKEDFLDRLTQEKKATPTVNEKVQPPRREDVLMENLKKAGVEDFIKKKAVPGTAIEGEKNWVVGKYGRVLPVVYLRRRDKRKVAKFDPSKYSHHLKQIKDEDGMQCSKVSSVTWGMENKSGHSQKRQLIPKQKKCPEKKNSKHRSIRNGSGYMFNFFGNEKEDGDDDQVDDTSSEAETVNEEDSESDSDTTEDSGPSVPNMKRRKTSDGTREQSIKMDTNTPQDSWQPVSSGKKQTDYGSDSSDTDEICASKQRQCKEGKLSSKKVKETVQQEVEFASLQVNSNKKTKSTIVKEKSGEFEVDDKNDVKHQEKILTGSGINDQKSSRDGNRHDPRYEYNDRRNSKEDHVDDSTIDDSDDDTSGSDDDGSGEGKKDTESDNESADTDDICSMKQRQNQIKVKTEKCLRSAELEVEDENAQKNQEIVMTVGGINGEKSSGSGNRLGTRSKIIDMSNNVEGNVDDVSMSSDDTSGSDDDSNSEEKKETESDDESTDVDEICSRKQKQRQADAKTKHLKNNGVNKVLIQSTKSHKGSNVSERDAAISVNSEKSKLLVRKSGSESNDSNSDTDGSSSSSAPSLKRKRESNEGSSKTDRIGSSKKGKDIREGMTMEQQSPKKLRREEPTSNGEEGEIGLLSSQGSMPEISFELLMLDRDILIKQGYNTAGVEGEQSSLEDELELSESDSDSDGSEKEKSKGKKKGKMVMPEFKGMNFFRKHFRDGDSNDSKESQMSKAQDLSTDELNARSKNELVTVTEGVSPGRNGATSLKKRKRRKDNHLDLGDSADTLETSRATQLKMRMGKVSGDSSDEDVQEQVDEESSKDEMVGIERQEEKETVLCEAEDRREEMASKSISLSKKLLEDSGGGRDADDESSDLENSVDGDTGNSSKKRKKKKKNKDKQKQEEYENKTETGKNAAAFSDSLSLINAVQNKYSREVELPESSNTGDKQGEIDEATKDGSEGNELKSERRGLKGENSVISSGGESLEDTGKTFSDRMTEFGQKFVEKRKISGSGSNSKEVSVKKRRQASSEKPHTGTDEGKKEKTKTDISNKDTAEISNQRRLQAIKERREELKNKKKAIRSALAKVDEREKPDSKKHMRFDSESEEDAEVAEEAEKEKKSISNEPSLSLFTGEDDEESGSGEDWFQVKPQFEGEKGLELLKLQRKFGDDERFKLDERFAEDDEEDNDEDGDDAEENHEEDGEEGDLETEKTKSLSILENVLGSMLPAKKSTDDKKAKFRDIGQVRFDPSREDHTKFLLPQQEVSETNSKSKKKRKKKKNSEEANRIVEAPLPEVSKEVFFDVKSDLTSALTQSQPVTFGFFNDNEDEETHENKEEEYFPPPADFVWEKKKKLPFDSSDSEGEAEETDTTKQEAPSVEKPREMEQQAPKSFFFGRNDLRLKDGASQFCRSKYSPFKDNWEEKKTELWAATYKRHQKALRDNKQNRTQRRPFKHH